MVFCEISVLCVLSRAHHQDADSGHGGAATGAPLTSLSLGRLRERDGEQGETV